MEMVVLDLRKSDAFTDFFVIATGANSRQVQAIADAVEQALKAQGSRPAYVEGYRSAEWILLDYFDFVVHVFSPSARTFYGLERLWGTARHAHHRRGRAGVITRGVTRDAARHRQPRAGADLRAALRRLRRHHSPSARRRRL